MADGAAESVWKAVTKKMLITTPAGIYVVPPWLLNRLFPQGYQLIARLMARFAPTVAGARDDSAPTAPTPAARAL
ncbi:hypothetical protein [Nocardia sp. NPDC051833]|uniref:hypothetical protein n=1 Tax=Nocardia sp. NPDC051833 TaxID=3155674 RepID=UPI003421DB4C